MKIYSEKYLVKSYETDMNASLKLFTFMNYAQEIAGQHATLLGFGYDTLIKEGVVWVLSRMHIIFKDIPPEHPPTHTFILTYNMSASFLFLTDSLYPMDPGSSIATLCSSLSSSSTLISHP